LNAVNFQWTLQSWTAISWSDRFEALKKFKDEHGHCDIPHDHPDFGNWPFYQRNQYKLYQQGKKSKLTKEKVDKLTAIGFLEERDERQRRRFEAQARRGGRGTDPAQATHRLWDDNLQDFVRWKKKHGHPYVPTKSDGPYKQLGCWVAGQRVAYKAYLARQQPDGGRYNNQKRVRAGKLTANKVLRLVEAGFAFDASHVRKTPSNGAAAKDAAREAEAEAKRQAAAKAKAAAKAAAKPTKKTARKSRGSKPSRQQNDRDTKKALAPLLGTLK